MYFPFSLRLLIVDIVFPTQFMGVNDSSITDFAGLTELGQEKVSALVQTLKSTTSAASVSGVNASFILLFIVSTIMMYM
jgi:hypothetical protein